MCFVSSDRAPAVGLTLEALRQRVALRQRTKERSSEATGRYKTGWHGVLDAPLENDAGRKLGTIENTYESLIKCREQVSTLRDSCLAVKVPPVPLTRVDLNSNPRRNSSEWISPCSYCFVNRNKLLRRRGLLRHSIVRKRNAPALQNVEASV